MNKVTGHGLCVSISTPDSGKYHVIHTGRGSHPLKHETTFSAGKDMCQSPQ